MHRTRKIELLRAAQLIMNDMPSSVKGNKSLAQELINRIEQVTKTRDEFNWMVEAVTLMIYQADGREVQVMANGRIVGDEELFRDFVILIKKPSKNSAN